MVQSIIDLDKEKDKVLNIVKAQHGFKNKSQALSLILEVYSDSFLEPQLRPEFLEKLKEIKNQKGIRFNSVDELRNSIENA